MNSGVKGKVGGLLLRNEIRGVADKFDASRYGGAVLLGLQAPVVKAHGAADVRTVYYTIKQVADMVSKQTITKFVQYFDAHKIAVPEEK